MKIIKRSGAESVFDITKIIIAITKANDSVAESDRITAEQVSEIAKDVEKVANNRRRALSVEEIHDLV
jgi:ribonucleoside-triphosphate reductase